MAQPKPLVNPQPPVDSAAPHACVPAHGHTPYAFSCLFSPVFIASPPGGQHSRPRLCCKPSSTCSDVLPLLRGGHGHAMPALLRRRQQGLARTDLLHVRPGHRGGDAAPGPQEAHGVGVPRLGKRHAGHVAGHGPAQGPGPAGAARPVRGGDPAPPAPVVAALPVRPQSTVWSLLGPCVQAEQRLHRYCGGSSPRSALGPAAQVRKTLRVT